MRLISITSFALCITAAPLLASGQTPPHPGAGVEVAGDAVVAHPTPTPAWRRGAAAVLEYRLAVEADGSSWGTWLVVQGEDFGVARWIEEDQPGEVALVAGSATGGLPAPRCWHG